MPKVGKTSLSAQLDGALLLAFEKGYNALPGVIAQDITSWSDFKAVLRELKKPEVKERFKSIVIDTVDLAAQFCEKYICAQQGVDNVADLGYGKGFKMVQTELEENFRSIAQMGYALFFISHSQDKTFKCKDGTEYNMITPTLSPSFNRVIAGMSDIYAYAHTERTTDGTNKVVLTIRSLDGTADTGCRFEYIEPEVPFTYEALSKALNDAIDKISENNGAEAVTNVRPVVKSAPVLNFDELMLSFRELVDKLQASAGADFPVKYVPRITEITNKHLGKGKKVNDCTPEQVEMLACIVSDLEELVEAGI